MVEHIVHIDGVTGSSPVQTIKKPRKVSLAGLFRFILRLIFRSFVPTENGSRPRKHRASSTQENSQDNSQDKINSVSLPFKKPDKITCKFLIIC